MDFLWTIPCIYPCLCGYMAMCPSQIEPELWRQLCGLLILWHSHCLWHISSVNIYCFNFRKFESVVWKREQKIFKKHRKLSAILYYWLKDTVNTFMWGGACFMSPVFSWNSDWPHAYNDLSVSVYWALGLQLSSHDRFRQCLCWRESERMFSSGCHEMPWASQRRGGEGKKQSRTPDIHTS